MVTVTSPPSAENPEIAEIASKKDIIHMIINYLKQEKMDDVAHTLERESGVFFDLQHFETLALDGDLDEAAKYLSGFTSINQNPRSWLIFFELKKQNYLEALDKKDRDKALDILVNDFKAFIGYEHIFKEASVLITMENFREHPSYAHFGNLRVERLFMIQTLRNHIFLNPVLSQKMQVPQIARNQNLKQLIETGELAVRSALGLDPKVQPKSG